MSDIIHETEINKTSEEPVEEIKRPRGRPRKAEEDKKPKYIPHPRSKKEKPIKEPKYRKIVFKPDSEVPFIRSKTGRRKGTILKPERYNEDGTYNKKPVDPEYYKKYYQQFVKHTPCTCDICGATISSKQKLSRHKKTQYCRLQAELKDVPDVVDLNQFLHDLSN